MRFRWSDFQINQPVKVTMGPLKESKRYMFGDFILLSASFADDDREFELSVPFFKLKHEILIQKVEIQQAMLNGRTRFVVTKIEKGKLVISEIEVLE